jgi:ADP-ribose pyrophosphatase YjhB (NUDIX family)
MTTRDINKISKAVVVNNKGKILLLYPTTKDKWHLPGGHLQQHETYLMGLKREVLEETNLQVTFFVLIDAKPGFQLWLCKCNQVPVKISSEHRSHKWLSFEDALTKLPITKETKRDLELAQKKIKRYANWFATAQPAKKTKTKKKQSVDMPE